MEVQNGSCLYQVGKKVGEAELYRLYLCRQVETGRECLFQIAGSQEQNGGLDLAAYVLGELAQRADELEEEYRSKNPDKVLNYGLGFPELVDSFVCQEQGGRRVNILAFRCVEEVGKMVPIINITEKDFLRVDLRTSAWIMGKSLKLLAFTQSEGISVEVPGNNILIEPDNHYVLIFDWTSARIYDDPGEMGRELRRGEITQAAKAVVTLLGGGLETGSIIDDGDEPFTRYVETNLKAGAKSPEELRQEAFGLYADMLLRLAHGFECDASYAHGKFYELVDALWPREFYPFTTKPL